MPRTREGLRQAAAKFERAGLRRIQGVFAGRLDLPDDFGAPRRRRLFTPAAVFWLFLAQVLSADGSCRETLWGFLAELFAAQGRTASPNTAAYCKARARLKTHEIKGLARDLAGRVEAQGKPWSWRGRRVRVADGTGVSMPDPPANQKAWPQSAKAKPGCSFPVMKMVGLFSLATGALLDLAHGALAVHETTLMRTLWPLLEKGDLLLADRGFCSFADFFLLARKGVDCVMRKNARRINAAVIKALGPNDHIVGWKKARLKPKWMDERTWSELPETMTVREVKVNVDLPGFRTQILWVVTTLLDHHKYPAAALAELYRRRWRVEIFFRDIKITMKMDVLRGQTPAMVEKELWMRVIAYNLIRGLMAEAAAASGENPERISFKGTVSALRQWAPMLAQTDIGPESKRPLYAALLHYLARDKVPSRPNRIEPRARKRRPKNYQLLNKPRHEFKEIMHRNHYRRA
jgi:hypothetical protein